VVFASRYTFRIIVNLALFARILVVAGALLAVGGPAAAAQTPGDSAVDAAERALRTGRYGEVDSLLEEESGRRALLLRGRAERLRGRYLEAEKLFAEAAEGRSTGDGALELGLLQFYLGRRPEARRTLQPVFDLGRSATSSAEALRAGLAALALGSFDEANYLYGDANRAKPNDPLVNTASGELFLERRDRQQAAEFFRVALAADPAWVPAQVGLARVLADQDPPEAREMVQKSLEVNPASLPALLLLADLDLNDAKRADARATIGKALAVNPNSLEARSIAAAIDYIEGRTAEFELAVAAVLEINPTFGDVYREAGDLAARNYRFEEAVVLTRKAIAIDDTAFRAWASLGIHLLRTGDEPAARLALETAFEGDRSDPVTKNLLALLDTLDGFVTITDGELVMRFDKDEAAVMREYALPLARQAIESLSERWGFRPTGPILIEMFPKHDDFAVRTLGLPGMLGALGACFGRVVTLDSPKARPPGTFNWGATLWHELAHVMTLQLSNQRIPRWLTEGISVFEEKRARREWGREQELEFAHAMNRGGVLTLRKLNAGFSDARTISLAYFEASLLVEHIVDRFGEGKLRDLVRSFTTGIDTEAALPQVLGVTIDELQVTFSAYLDEHFGSLSKAMKTPEMPKNGLGLGNLKELVEKNPGSYPLQVMLGQALRKSGDLRGALAALDRAAALAPTASGAESPNVLIASIAVEMQDNARAISALEALGRVDHVDIESARTLASLVAPLGDAGRAAAAYERVVGLDPFDMEAGANLGLFALEDRDFATAIRAFRGVLAAGPVDTADSHANLSEAYLLAGQLAEAKKQVLTALEIAPQFERAQELLLTIIETGR